MILTVTFLVAGCGLEPGKPIFGEAIRGFGNDDTKLLRDSPSPEEIEKPPERVFEDVSPEDQPSTRQKASGPTAAGEECTKNTKCQKGTECGYNDINQSFNINLNKTNNPQCLGSFDFDCSKIIEINGTNKIIPDDKLCLGSSHSPGYCIFKDDEKGYGCK